MLEEIKQFIEVALQNSLDDFDKIPTDYNNGKRIGIFTIALFIRTLENKK